QKVKERESSKETLWRILVAMESVDSDSVFEEAARIYAFPIADTKDKLDAKFVRSVMETLSEENRDRLLNLHLVPFECETEQQSGTVKLVFITHDPMRTEVRRVMKELKLDRFDLYYAPRSAVESVIVEAFPRKNEFMERILDDPMAFDLGMSYEETEIIDEDALEAEISRSSLINLFEATLVEAVRQGASDVHIYPNAKKKVEIHFRIDGRLSLWHTEHKVHPEALLAVIKDNAMNVDRFERDAAQDGYIQRWIDDVLIRFRVSVLPIANVSHEIRSESIVIRVLDDRKVIRDLRKLGLLESAMETFETAISQPHGMVILTGPTGSGKSTTLVAALHHVINGEVNVLTVEDPVEYIIPGVRQIKLNFKLELENALRAILRHDPDIVMVGEMRDRKTAELAIKLANTGHLTFSTLHTNDAPSAVSRLYKMGIEPFLLAYAINLIVAQRLIRKLCLTCRQQDLDPDPVMLDKLGFTAEEIANITFYEPGSDSSCPTCKGVGYKGRRAICEALFFSREIRHMIVEADKMIDEGAIKEQAVKEGMLTLRDSAREIVKLGETSVREMIRVVTAEG
ncbi:MAG: GspE/PulE family protein, partial [Rhodothermales bacterium]